MWPLRWWRPRSPRAMWRTRCWSSSAPAWRSWAAITASASTWWPRRPAAWPLSGRRMRPSGGTMRISAVRRTSGSWSRKTARIMTAWWRSTWAKWSVWLRCPSIPPSRTRCMSCRRTRRRFSPRWRPPATSSWAAR